MKFLIIATLVACAFANTMPFEMADLELLEDEDLQTGCLDTGIGLEACESLMPMPFIGGASMYGDVTMKDDLLNRLVNAKLKALGWLVGKVAGPEAEAFVKKFIEEHREEVEEALRNGGRKLLSMLKDLYSYIKEKVTKSSWWQKIKDKLGDVELLEDEELQTGCLDTGLGLDACQALMPMPFIGGATTYGDMTMQDDLLNRLVNAKLKALGWLVGKIAGPNAEALIKQFIEKHRDEVEEALRNGGRKLLSMLKDLLKSIKEKVEKSNWWQKLKNKLG